MLYNNNTKKLFCLVQAVVISETFTRFNSALEYICTNAI